MNIILREYCVVLGFIFEEYSVVRVDYLQRELCCVRNIILAEYSAVCRTLPADNILLCGESYFHTIYALFRHS